MRCEINHKRLISLLEIELGDKFGEFQQKFSLHLCTLENVLSGKKIGEYAIREALLKAVTDYDSFLSLTMKTILGYIVINSDSVSQRLPQQHIRADKPLKAKPAPTLQSSRSNVAKVPSLDQSLSRKKIKAVHKSMKNKLESETALYSCRELGCKTCQRLFKEVPLTRCTHPKPCNDIGYYPHLSRKLVRKVHFAKDYTLLHSLDGIKNPFKEDQVVKPNTMEIDRCSDMSASVSERPAKRKRSEECTLSDIEQMILQPIKLADKYKLLARARLLKASSELIQKISSCQIQG